MRFSKYDTAINEDAYLYRYSIKTNKIRIFSKTAIVHRKWNNKIDLWIAFPPGNYEGINVSDAASEVSTYHGVYFYIWSDEEIPIKDLRLLFLVAIKKYYTEKINKLSKKINEYNNKINATIKHLSDS